MKELLKIEDLKIDISSGSEALPVVLGVSLSLFPGRTLALVGESGCGKSLTALSVLGLLPDPPIRIAGGHIWFHGRDLAGLDGAALREVRGRQISMVFQEPMTALNPVYTVGDQVAEVFRTHLGLGAAESLERAVAMLETVGIPDAGERAGNYPHQMSGGMRQRVLIAIALACRPEILIADEPTTALDVTVQAQILDLVKDLRDDLGASVLLITHNFGVVAETADDVAVMYAGRIVEETGCEELFRSPWHPYTVGLLGSRPRPGRRGGERGRLDAIPGAVPAPGALPAGCPFEPRCVRRQNRCREELPLLEEKSPGHRARCFFPPKGGAA